MDYKPNLNLGYASVDASVIGKLSDSGYQVTNTGKTVDSLSFTTGVSKQLLPGASVPGYTDGAGNFLVVDENGRLNDVRRRPTGPTGVGGGFTDGPSVGPTDGFIPGGGGAINDLPPILPPTLPPNGGGGGGMPPTPGVPPTPLPPPGAGLGSGKIFTRFDVGDIIPNQQETVTRALWCNNVGNITTFFTSSAQTATQKRYYYEVYNSASSACGACAMFSVAYGHKQGSGSADEGGQINDTPSRAIYGQYRLLCLNSDQEQFTIGGSTTEHIYAVNVNRARMREYLDEGNIELNLAHLSGSEFVAGGGLANAYTGSNVTIAGNGKVLRLIDDSNINDADITEAGEVYQMVSGSIENGVYNSSNPHVYGLLYRRLGIIVLDANKLNDSASFGTVTGSEVPGDNAYKLFTAVSGAALYTDLSGDPLGFQGRSAEKVKSTHFFCRVKNAEYNFSNNPSFTTGSEGDLAQPTFLNDPRTYITTVGLYNSRKELVAVAKLSKALQKSFTKEALIKVKLDF